MKCWDTVSGMVERALVQEKFRLVIPAFPVKFSNPRTTLSSETGGAVDQAEALAISFLAELVREIRVVRPEARLILALDGLLATDLMAKVWPDFGEATIRRYVDTLRELIVRLGAADLMELMSLDDFFDSGTTEEKVQKLVASWGAFRTPEAYYEYLMSSPELVADYSSMKKFIEEDSSASPTYCHMSKRQRNDVCRALTLGFVHRSSAWTALVGSRFAGALRLSIHQWWPHNTGKIGVYLCPSRDNIVSPWRGVGLLDIQTGKWHLVKRHEAEAARAVLDTRDGLLYYRYASPAAAPRIARLDLLAETSSIPLAQSLVRAAALQAGIDAEAALPLELLVEEGCLNVINHAYPDGDVGPLSVELSKTQGSLIIGIEDRGIPFDAGQLTGPGIGGALTRHFADEVRLVNLGTGGKRFELVKLLPMKEEPFEAASEKVFHETGVESAPGEVTVRPALPNDALGIARCAFHVFGPSWASDPGYRPEKLTEAYSSGNSHGFVAVSSSGDIAGHVMLAGIRPGFRIAAAALELEDVRYRGQHVLDQLLRSALEKGRGLDLFGVTAQASAAQTLSQESHLSAGGHEAAILLGYFPEGLLSRGFSAPPGRISSVSYHHVLPGGPARTLYVPVHHAGILRRMVEELGLTRDVRVPDRAPVLPAGDGLLEVHVDRSSSRAVISVQQVAEETVSWVERHRREMGQSRIDLVLLDLPLSDPSTAFLCAACENLGFGFSGIVPELGIDGDILRLQWLAGPKVPAASLHMASAMGRELCDYVLASASAA